MLKHLFAAAAFAVLFTAPADAQDGTLPAIDTMTCDQMNAEMMVAGMQMNAQLDHEGLAADNQAMQDDMARRQRQGMAGAGAAAAVCAIPGAGMACVAAQQAQIAQATQGMAESQARSDRQTQRIQDSMAGIDQNRMMSMMQRYEALNCQTPQ